MEFSTKNCTIDKHVHIHLHKILNINKVAEVISRLGTTKAEKTRLLYNLNLQTRVHQIMIIFEKQMKKVYRFKIKCISFIRYEKTNKLLEIIRDELSSKNLMTRSH